MNDIGHAPQAGTAGLEGYYGFAEVGRYGLGHSLLAWARCRLWCDDHQVPMLAPSWNQLRIGPMLRGERDKRQYHLLFRFDGYVTGLNRWWLLQRQPKVEATSIVVDELPPRGDGHIVVFRNLERLNEETHFHEVCGRGAQVRAALDRMTKPRYRPVDPRVPIAIHVRMGDFREVESIESLRAGAKNARIPVSWYASMLSGVRRELGAEVPAMVFSDGSDEQLAELLRLPAVRRSPRQQSITDLLSMSRSRLLISSGSGFSMWGTFLGDMQRICFPGQRLVRVLHSTPELDREPECENAAELSPTFIAHLRDAFDSL